MAVGLESNQGTEEQIGVGVNFWLPTFRGVKSNQRTEHKFWGVSDFSRHAQINSRQEVGLRYEGSLWATTSTCSILSFDGSRESEGFGSTDLLQKPWAPSKTDIPRYIVTSERDMGMDVKISPGCGPQVFVLSSYQGQTIY